MTQPSAAWTRIKHRIGSHPFISVVLASAVIYAATQAFIAFNNQPRCDAIWAETRIIVRATLTECERSTVPIKTKIPSDAMLESATLDGGPPN